MSVRTYRLLCIYYIKGEDNMSERKKIKTKRAEIVEYWAAHQNESGLSIDWIDLKNH